MYARLLRTNVAGHLSRPQTGRLSDARHLFAERFAHHKGERVAEALLQRTVVHLVDGQRYGAGDCQAGTRIVEVAGPPLGAGQIAEREDVSGAGLQQQQHHDQNHQRNELP